MAKFTALQNFTHKSKLVKAGDPLELSDKDLASIGKGFVQAVAVAEAEADTTADKNTGTTAAAKTPAAAKTAAK